MKQANADIQVGVNLDMHKLKEKRERQAKENKQIFGTDTPQTFLSMRTEEGDILIMEAHKAAREAIHELAPHIKVGLTLSLHDYQPIEGGEQSARKEWEDEFVHYLPYLKDDDFFGLQNYTRKIVGPEGVLPVPTETERTQMDYEFYPLGVSNVIRKVHNELPIPIMVTENGIATSDDSRRVAFIEMKISKMIQFENTNPPRKRRNKGFRHIRCCRESLFFVPWNDCV